MEYRIGRSRHAKVAVSNVSTDVIDVLSDLFILRGVPEHIRSYNGPEFVAKAVQKWFHAVGAKTAYIAPGSPWENGYVESFNARLRGPTQPSLKGRMKAGPEPGAVPANPTLTFYLDHSEGPINIGLPLGAIPASKLESGAISYLRLDVR